MKEISGYKTRLEEEKVKLEKELASVGRSNPLNPRIWEPKPQEVGQEPDPNDAADIFEGYEENAGIMRDLGIRYNEVMDALVRIEQGTYGVCSVGNEDIETDRLASDPAANTCKKHLS